MADIDSYTGSQLNTLEADLSRKMRAGDATPAEIQKYNMVARRMGNVNVPLARARSAFSGVLNAEKPAPVHHRRPRHRRKKGKKKKK